MVRFICCSDHQLRLSNSGRLGSELHVDQAVTVSRGCGDGIQSELGARRKAGPQLEVRRGRTSRVRCIDRSGSIQGNGSGTDGDAYASFLQDRNFTRTYTANQIDRPGNEQPDQRS